MLVLEPQSLKGWCFEIYQLDKATEYTSCLSRIVLYLWTGFRSSYQHLRADKVAIHVALCRTDRESVLLSAKVAVSCVRSFSFVVFMCVVLCLAFVVSFALVLLSNGQKAHSSALRLPPRRIHFPWEKKEEFSGSSGGEFWGVLEEFWGVLEENFGEFWRSFGEFMGVFWKEYGE